MEFLVMIAIFGILFYVLSKVDKMQQKKQKGIVGATSYGNILIKALRAVGFLTVAGGLILGISAGAREGDVRGSGWAIFISFVLPFLVGIIASLSTFWLAEHLSNQKEMIKQSDILTKKISEHLEGQNEILKKLDELTELNTPSTNLPTEIEGSD